MLAGQLEIELVANVARLLKDMESVKGSVGGTFKAINDGAAFATKALGLLGVGFSAVQFTQFVKGSIDAADHLNDLSKTTGLTVEQLSGLELASKQTGGQLDSTAKAINMLAKKMGEDSEKFKALGITAQEPLEAFKQLSDIFVSIQDPQDRAAFGAETLGRAWETVAPLLAEGGDNIGKMVEQGTRLSGMTTELAQKSDEYNDKMETLKTVTASWGASIASSLLPGLIGVSEWLLKITDEQEYLRLKTEEYTAAIKEQVGELEKLTLAGAADKAEVLNGKLEEMREKLILLNQIQADADRRGMNIDVTDKIKLLTAEIGAQEKAYQELIVHILDASEATDGGAAASAAAAYVTAEERKKRDAAAVAAGKQAEAVKALTDKYSEEYNAIGLNDRELAKYKATQEALGKGATPQLAEEVGNLALRNYDAAKSFSDSAKAAEEAGKSYIEYLDDLASERERVASETANGMAAVEKTIADIAIAENERATKAKLESEDRFRDGTKEILGNAINDWKNFGDFIEDYFKSALANMAADLLTSDVLRLLKSMTGLGPGSSQSGLSSLTGLFSGGGGLSSITRLLSGGSKLFNSTTGFWQAPSMTSGGGLMTGLKTGAAGVAGGYVGTEVGEGLFGKEAESQWGAIAGGLLGSMFGPLGAFIGGSIGGALDAAFGGDGVKRSNAGFLIGSTPGAKQEYLGQSRTFASGITAQEFTRRGDKSVSSDILDTFYAADKKVVDLVEALGGTLKATHVLGRGEESAAGSAGNFWGVGLAGSDVGTQLNNFIDQITENISGLDAELLQAVKAASTFDEVVALLTDAQAEFAASTKAAADALDDVGKTAKGDLAAFAKESIAYWGGLNDRSSTAIMEKGAGMGLSYLETASMLGASGDTLRKLGYFVPEGWSPGSEQAGTPTYARTAEVETKNEESNKAQEALLSRIASSIEALNNSMQYAFREGGGQLGVTTV